jgi:hypothetical protein
MQRKWLTVTYEDGTKWVQNLSEDGTGEVEIPSGKRIVRIAVSDTRHTPIARALAEDLDGEERR